MSACPTCGKPVDSLRAPAASVRDGKIVAFCSKECAAGESKPIAMPQRAESKPGVAAKIARRTPAAGVPKSVADLDSGPVIEILHEPASGVVASSADARSNAQPPSRRSQVDGAIEIADTGHIEDYAHPEEPIHRRRGTLVFLLLLLVVAGGGAAAYYLGYLDQWLGRDNAAAATRLPPPPEPAKAIADAAPPPIEPAEALARALDLLHTQLQSQTPRVQRLAALALSRTADKAALDWLAKDLDKETTDAGKLENAYALARAGDKRGTEVLVASLVSPRRETKAEAARKLALLGDQRAVSVLDQFFEYQQFRLQAAAQLALFADPRALEFLDKLRADPKTPPDDQATAAIALGMAGRGDVADALHQLLPDARFNAFASAALVTLHDQAARPILEKQLAFPSLRVAAARWLRKLDPKLDVKPLIPALAAELQSSKDTEQVQAAEAILVLAGSSSWSARE